MGAEGKSYNTLLEEYVGSAGPVWRCVDHIPTHDHPMALSLDDVSRIAQLARLEATPEEAQRFLAQLQSIFRLIEELQSVDTRGIEPMSHAQNASSRLREDQVTERDQHELFQSIAPQVEAGLYLVPKVIE
jgi:aspartyl-tRNA(Asn)/glutamyl-tRNA(Gln) amidotransferase subunit C